MEIHGLVLSAGDLYLLSICGALIMAWIGYRLALSVQKQKAFSAAAFTFRKKILTELEGLYPMTRYWDENEFSRFSQSIPKIDRAAAEFRYFVKHKTDFDIAIDRYREYCRTITWNKCVQWDMYPSLRKPGDKRPIEKLIATIKELLSYAGEK